MRFFFFSSLLLPFLFAPSAQKPEEQRVTSLLKDPSYAEKHNRLEILEICKKTITGPASHLKFHQARHLVRNAKWARWNFFPSNSGGTLDFRMASFPDLCPQGLNYPKRICYLTFSTHVSSALIEINPTLRLRSQC